MGDRAKGLLWPLAFAFAFVVSAGSLEASRQSDGGEGVLLRVFGFVVEQAPPPTCHRGTLGCLGWRGPLSFDTRNSGRERNLPKEAPSSPAPSRVLCMIPGGLAASRSETCLRPPCSSGCSQHLSLASPFLGSYSGLDRWPSFTRQCFFLPSPGLSPWHTVCPPLPPQTLAPQRNRSLVWFSLIQARLPCPPPAPKTQPGGLSEGLSGGLRLIPTPPPLSPSWHLRTAGWPASSPPLFTWSELPKVSLFSLALDLSELQAFQPECWSL